MEAICITAIPTIVIAIATIINTIFVWKIKSKDEQNKRETADLFQAIVVSNPIKGENTPQNIKKFIKHYKGKSIIFPDPD